MERGHCSGSQQLMNEISVTVSRTVQGASEETADLGFDYAGTAH